MIESNYKQLNEIIDNIIFEKLLRNQNVCKLLYCYPKEAEDWDYNPFDEPDIKDTTGKLFMKHIFPLPKMPKADTDQNGSVLVNVSGGHELENNSTFRKVDLFFDIIYHLNVWRIQGGYRPLYMMYEINNMINNQLTDLPIENRPYLVGFQPRDYSNYFYGFQLKYSVIVTGDLKCSPIPKNIGIQKGVPYTPDGNKSFLPRNVGEFW